MVDLDKYEQEYDGGEGGRTLVKALMLALAKGMTLQYRARGRSPSDDEQVLWWKKTSRTRTPSDYRTFHLHLGGHD